MAGGTDPTVRKTFLAHVHELQLRLTWAVLAIMACGIGAYSFHQPILDLVQRPLGETLYYTSPTGGFSFLFKMCAVAGIVMALPVILYQLFKFLGPLLNRQHRLDIVTYTLWSINLAYAGVLFAYLVSLPAALHFLAKFGGDNIQGLITADAYFNFALAYLGGFAVLFQLPLIILFTNRIKPLKPSQMMAGQRYIILGSFIIAAILTPTPDPVNQAIMAVPVVLLYQVSIVMVWLLNRTKRHRPAVAARKPILPPIPATIVPVSESLGYGMSGYGLTPEKPKALTTKPLMADIVLR